MNLDVLLTKPKPSDKFWLANLPSRYVFVLAIAAVLNGCAIPSHQDSEKLLLLRYKNRGRYYAPGNTIRYWLRSEDRQVRHKGLLISVSDSSIQVSEQKVPLEDIWYLKKGWKVNLDKWKPQVVDFGELVEIVNDF